MPWGTRMCNLGGEAVGHEAGHGKPAGRIEQVADGLLDGGELEAFDGAVFVAGDDAVVDEGPVDGLAVDEGRVCGDADGAVGGALALEEFAGVVGDFGDFERGMEAEGDDVEVGGRGEGDLRGGGEVVRGGVELGVNDVAGDVEGGAGDLGGGREGGGCGEGHGETGEYSAGCAGVGRPCWKSFRDLFIRSLMHSGALHGLVGSLCVSEWLEWHDRMRRRRGKVLRSLELRWRLPARWRFFRGQSGPAG